MGIDHFFATASGRGMQGDSDLYHCLLSPHRMHFFLARISWVRPFTSNLRRGNRKIHYCNHEASSEEYSF